MNYLVLFDERLIYVSLPSALAFPAAVYILLSIFYFMLGF
jgi:hypothetical protein